MDTFVALCLGIGLSAAVGLRIFVPPFLVGLAAAAGWIQLPGSVEWLGSPVAITAFGIAMVVEVLAYTIPWLDNLLDTVAAPAALVAGVLLTAGLLADMPPALQWTLALIAGGGASATTQGLTTTARAASTVSTAGTANPVVSMMETAGSSLTTVLSLLVPVAVAGVVVLLAGFVGWRVARLRRRRSSA